MDWVVEMTVASRRDAAAVTVVNDLVDVFRDARSGHSDEKIDDRCRDFVTRAERDARAARNFVLVLARAGDKVIGFVFGYSLEAGSTWWDGLTPGQPEAFTLETGRRTAVLAEIAVRRTWQRSGIGHMLQSAFLGNRTEPRATLVCDPLAVRIHRLYEKWGWQKVGTLPGREGEYYAEYVSFMRALPEHMPSTVCKESCCWLA